MQIHLFEFIINAWLLCQQIVAMRFPNSEKNLSFHQTRAICSIYIVHSSQKGICKSVIHVHVYLPFATNCIYEHRSMFEVYAYNSSHWIASSFHQYAYNPCLVMLTHNKIKHLLFMFHFLHDFFVKWSKVHFLAAFNFYFDHILWIVRNRDFILGMHISTMWPFKRKQDKWPCDLNWPLFCKQLFFTLDTRCTYIVLSLKCVQYSLVHSIFSCVFQLLCRAFWVLVYMLLIGFLGNMVNFLLMLWFWPGRSSNI